MDIAQQKQIFRHNNVLVKADIRQETRRKKSDDFDTKTLARYVDIHSPLQALGTLLFFSKYHDPKQLTTIRLYNDT